MRNHGRGRCLAGTVSIDKILILLFNKQTIWFAIRLSTCPFRLVCRFFIHIIWALNPSNTIIHILIGLIIYENIIWWALKNVHFYYEYSSWQRIERQIIHHLKLFKSATTPDHAVQSTIRSRIVRRSCAA